MPRITVKGIGAEEIKIYNNVANYVSRHDKSIQGLIGATHLYLGEKRNRDISLILQQMLSYRQFYNQVGKRLGIHVIIEFSSEENKYLTSERMLQIGYHIAETEFIGCPTYFAVHDHGAQLHLDMLLIPMDVYTGLMYGCDKSGWRRIEINLIQYLKGIMPEECVGGIQVSFGKY